MGRDQDHSVRRGVADANLLLANGVNCSLASNNILNPATPYGDCSLIRLANLYANVLQVDRTAQCRECFDMLTERSARLLNVQDYGFAVGNPADVVVIDARSPEQAVAEIANRSRLSSGANTPSCGIRPSCCDRNARHDARLRIGMKNLR